MKNKRLLAGIISAAMVLGTMAFPVFAENTSITFDEFVAAVEKNGGTFDGKNTTTVTWEPVTGCRQLNRTHTCTANATEATASTPNAVNSKLAQYYLFEGLQDLNISGVDFKFIPKDFTVCENSLTAGSFTTEQAVGGQLKLHNSGNVTITDCTFDNVTITPWSLEGNNVDENRTVDVEDCTFKNVMSYGLKDVQAGNVVIKRNTFDNTKSGIMLSGATVKNAVIDTNTFSCNAELGGDLIQIASSYKFDDASSLAIINNTSTTDTSVLRALNPDMPSIIFGNNTIPQTAPLTSSDTPEAMADSINDKLINPVASIGDTYYTSLADAVTAANDGDTVTIIGTITVGNNDFSGGADKNLIFDGKNTGELYFANRTYGQYIGLHHNKKITFNNLTMTWGTADYVGLAHGNEKEYNHCTIKGKVFLYETTETFNDCQFIQDNADYNVWTYSAKTATFNNCTFSGKGKAILVYNELYNGKPEKDYLAAEPNKVYVNGCKFYASSSVSGKAAIEVDSSLCPFGVEIANSTAEGFAENTKSGSQLYNIKKIKEDLTDSSKDKTSLKVDDEEISIRPVSIVWDTLTDSGFYEADGKKYGVMRFSFRVNPSLTDITEAGIKFSKADNPTAEVSGTVVSKEGAINVFYGDITNIGDGDANNCYAIAYIKTAAGKVWSEVVKCSVDWNKRFTGYTPGGAE